MALLAPTVNIIRHPQGGRSFENFSEDTFLSGAMASAYIQGLQEEVRSLRSTHHSARI